MPYRHRTLTAWLGLLAIWLAIVGPLASQCRVAADNASPVAGVCGATHHVHRASMPAGTHHALHLDACGYCGFFAHSPAIGSPVVTLGALPEPTLVSGPAPVEAVASAERYRHAYARAPPENA